MVSPVEEQHIEDQHWLQLTTYTNIYRNFLSKSNAVLFMTVQYQPIDMPKPEEKDYTWIGRDCAAKRNLPVVLSNKSRKLKAKAALIKQ